MREKIWAIWAARCIFIKKAGLVCAGGKIKLANEVMSNGTLLLILKSAVGFGILNVWILRFNKATPYRGGNARTMPEEFVAYGLPVWLTYVVGALKVLSALWLLGGIWAPLPAAPAATVLCVLMVGALLMHVKVRDPLLRSVPAALMLALNLAILQG
jgi:DoxX-like family